MLKRVKYYLMALFFAIGIIFGMNNQVMAAIPVDDIGDYPEAGSVYVARGRIVATTDGTAEWDADDSPGNDSGPDNGIIRTFDTLRYDYEVVLSTTPEAEYDYYGNGRVGFRVAVPYPKNEVNFDLSVMGWCDDTPGYEKRVVEEEIGGVTYTILTCYRRLEGNASEPNVIPGTLTVMFPLTVGATKNGDVIRPEIWSWVEGDEPLREDIYGNDIGRYSICDPITVSAKPNYNVRIAGTSDPTGRGDYDFSTGNDNALNKDAGVVNGRMFSLGLTLQLMNENTAKRLKGIEFPTGPITFDVVLTSQFIPASGSPDMSTHDSTEQFKPLVWSLTSNRNASVKDDGRNVTLNYADRNYADGANPWNQGTSWNSCYNGGTWTATQEGNVVHITVSDYVINPEHFPYYGCNQNDMTYQYYNPETGVGNVGCFSAGSLYVIAPFNDDEEQNILDVYNATSGNIVMRFADQNMQATSISGISVPEDVTGVTNQARRTDDTAAVNLPMYRPGGWSQRIAYSWKNNTGAAEQGTDHKDYRYAYSTGEDSAFVGETISMEIGSCISVYGELPNLMMGTDVYAKFDDKCLEYDPTYAFGKNKALCLDPQYDGKILFVAKSDRSGWSSDDEMNASRIYDDNLVFFEDYNELVDGGYTCIGFLFELHYCELDSDASRWRDDFFVNVPVRVLSEADNIGKVAMICAENVGWRRKYFEDEVAAFVGKDIEDLVHADYQAFAVSDNMPSVLRDNTVDEFVHPSDRVYTTYVKAYYNENGYAGGHTGSYTYGDSLLILGEEANIAKAVAQKSGSSPKVMFDMDYQQRIVDYVLTPTLHVSDGVDLDDFSTTITVVDTLPAALSYISGSAYYGGTYTEHTPEQGTIEGGEVLNPQVERVGTNTKLTFTIENVKPGEEQPIHFSATIGTPGEEETDVVNMQQITNTVSIQSTYDKRAIKAYLGNLASTTITISKLRAQSLSVTPKPILNDIESEISFNYKVSNRSNIAYPTHILGLLPYNGDAGGSNYAGTYTVSSIVLDGEASGDLSDVTFWVTNDEAYRNVDIQGLDDSVVRNNFTQLTMDASTGVVTIPSGFSHMVAFAALDNSLAAGKSLSALVKLQPTGNDPNNVYGTSLTDFDNTVRTRLYTVARYASGLVWSDLNGDGIRQFTEPLLSNIRVRMLKSDNSILNNLRGDPCVVVTSDDGTYRFDSLPDGDYKIDFAPVSSGAWDAYIASPYHAPNAGQSVNCDGRGMYTSEVLKGMLISDVEMPAIEDMLASIYGAEHLDVGIAPPASITKAVESRIYANPEEITFTIDTHIPSASSTESHTSVIVTDELNDVFNYVDFDVIKDNTSVKSHWQANVVNNVVTLIPTDLALTNTWSPVGDITFEIVVTPKRQEDFDYEANLQVSGFDPSVYLVPNEATLEVVTVDGPDVDLTSNEVEVWVTPKRLMLPQTGGNGIFMIGSLAYMGMFMVGASKISKEKNKVC